MAATYLVEVRMGGEIKSRLRDIIRDIADTFDERTLVRSHYVPHITLYGSFRTNEEKAVLARIRDTCAQYDLIPYRLDGFDHFDRETIYADVESSPALRQLRYRLSQELQSITYNAPEYDSDRWSRLHSTVARDVENKFDGIWDYVTSNYDVHYDVHYEGYVERVTLVRNGNIVKEYSVPQGRFLGPEAATSRPGWNRDEELIDRYQQPDDHTGLVPSKPGRLRKWKTLISDRLPLGNLETRRNSEFERRPSRTFVCADLHLNHGNIIEYCDRQFESVHEMNQRLVANWNDAVGPEDTVVFLGDLAFYYGTITTNDWLHALDGEIVFIRGNHDGAESIDYEDDYVLETEERKYFCTHRPEDVPENWDGWVLHGHEHNNDVEQYPLINADEKRVNVAPELTNYRPISMDYLEKLLSQTSSKLTSLDNASITPNYLMARAPKMVD